MNLFWHVLLLGGIWAGRTPDAVAQTSVSAEKNRGPSATTNQVPDSTRTRVARPNSLTFTASTDQRFFFFNDTRNDNGRRIPVTVYGLRAGFLFSAPPVGNAGEGASRIIVKTGMGFYFVNQTLNQPGLLPTTSVAVTRHLRIVTAFIEPYLLNKRSLKISLPVELGYGHSRYTRTNDRSLENEVARGFFLPAGVGVLTSYQFPSLRWFRPLHWFGLNVLTGYRFVLKKDIPASQINYTGFYVSVGPSFFLENLTADVKKWRKKRKKK